MFYTLVYKIVSIYLLFIGVLFTVIVIGNPIRFNLGVTLGRCVYNLSGDKNFLLFVKVHDCSYVLLILKVCVTSLTVYRVGETFSQNVKEFFNLYTNDILDP